MSLGANIRAARKAAKMTQAQLATALGVDQVSVARWEGNARLPRTARGDEIAAALGTTAGTPMDGSTRVLNMAEIDSLLGPDESPKQSVPISSDMAVLISNLSRAVGLLEGRIESILRRLAELESP